MSEEAVRSIVIDTINRAGAESGWVSMMFAAIVFGGLIGLAFIVSQILKAYFDSQKFIRTEFLAAVKANTAVNERVAEGLRHFADAILHAPCGQRPTEQSES